MTPCGPFRTRLRLKHFNKLVPIEGGRVLRSQELRDDFLYNVQASIDAFDTLAGFAFVCWNDEGETLSQATQAHFSPYQERDIPRVVRHEIARALAGGEPTGGDEYETDDGEE
jgi:hypothetical protein